MGLRVYGAEVFSRNDPGACQDSQLVAASNAQVDATESPCWVDASTP